jgi:hypothetical protein
VQERLLHHILCVRDRSEHPVGDADQLGRSGSKVAAASSLLSETRAPNDVSDALRAQFTEEG